MVSLQQPYPCSLMNISIHLNWLAQPKAKECFKNTLTNWKHNVNEKISMWYFFTFSVHQKWRVVCLFLHHHLPHQSIHHQISRVTAWAFCIIKEYLTVTLNAKSLSCGPILLLNRLKVCSNYVFISKSKTSSALFSCDLDKLKSTHVKVYFYQVVYFMLT